VPAAGTAPPRIYLITDRHATGGRSLETVVANALRALTTATIPPSKVAVQLREKDLGGRALLDLAVRLRAITAAAGVRLFINDRIDVALAVGADGVHLGGSALDIVDAHAIASSLTFAVSTHSMADVTRATADARISFAVFGPVFATPSKQIYGKPTGADRLREACAGALPVLALGGVDASNADVCLAARASGIACIRPVMSAADPEAALARLFEAIEST
jgi:thiamine-phosphate pyrophosphorylase